jgi:hypothetical protein
MRLWTMSLRVTSTPVAVALGQLSLASASLQTRKIVTSRKGGLKGCPAGQPAGALSRQQLLILQLPEFILCDKPFTTPEIDEGEQRVLSSCYRRD